jgi:hypothetical protein
VFCFGLRAGAFSAKLPPVAVPQRQSRNPKALNKLEKLSDQLETAADASEATTRASEATTRASEATTKDVQHARRTAETITRDIRLQQPLEDPKRKRRRSKDGYTEDGKSKAAVELGRKGGAARAKTLTRQQRSALAVKAAKTRWNRH